MAADLLRFAAVRRMIRSVLSFQRSAMIQQQA